LQVIAMFRWRIRGVPPSTQKKGHGMNGLVKHADFRFHIGGSKVREYVL
jgi:hypothetical protein